MRQLDKAWREGMDEDLKEKTVSEIFGLLLPGAGSTSERSKVKIKGSKLKKDTYTYAFRQSSLFSFI